MNEGKNDNWCIAVEFFQIENCDRLNGGLQWKIQYKKRRKNSRKTWRKTTESSKETETETEKQRSLPSNWFTLQHDGTLGLVDVLELREPGDDGADPLLLQHAETKKLIYNKEKVY